MRYGLIDNFMVQISEKIYCDKTIMELDIKKRLMPNPYYEYPYMIIKDFMNSNLANEITDSIYQNSNATRAKVKTLKFKSILNPTVNEEIRKTNIYDLPELYENIYQKLFEVHQASIERFFNISLTLSTPIQSLEYEKGSFYIKHADDSNELIDKDGNSVGFQCVAPNRKLTSVLFTTSHSEETSSDIYKFSGGELLFNYLYDENKNIVKFKPQQGDMILFFSNPIFSHEVKKVTSGYRVSLVQWHNGIVY